MAEKARPASWDSPTKRRRHWLGQVSPSPPPSTARARSEVGEEHTARARGAEWDSSAQYGNPAVSPRAVAPKRETEHSAVEAQAARPQTIEGQGHALFPFFTSATFAGTHGTSKSPPNTRKSSGVQRVLSSVWFWHWLSHILFSTLTLLPLPCCSFLVCFSLGKRKAHSRSPSL